MTGRLPHDDVTGWSSPLPSRNPVLSGATWISTSTAGQAVIAAGTQLLMARFLDATDFGIYALVASSSFPFALLAGGGLPLALQRKTSQDVADLLPTAFRFSILSSLLAVMGLVALAKPLAALFGEPSMMPLLFITAFGLLFQPYLAVTIPQLQTRLQFHELAIASFIGVGVQSTVALILSMAGFGPLSLVCASVAALAVNTAVLFTMTGIRPWRGPQILPLRHMARLGSWPLAGSVITHAGSRIDYFILGMFISTEVLGAYYFAFQIVTRGADVILSAARHILVPVLSRQLADVQRSALYAAGTALSVAAGALSFLLIAGISPANELIWSGHWSDSALAVMALSVALPLTVAQSAPEQLVKARGQFRLWTAMLSARSIVVAFTSLMVGLIGGANLTAAAIGAVVAVVAVVQTTAEVLVLARRLRYSFGRFMYRMAAASVPQLLLGYVAGTALAGSTLPNLASIVIVIVGATAGAILVMAVARRMGWLSTNQSPTASPNREPDEPPH